MRTKMHYRLNPTFTETTEFYEFKISPTKAVGIEKALI